MATEQLISLLGLKAGLNLSGSSPALNDKLLDSAVDHSYKSDQNLVCAYGSPERLKFAIMQTAHIMNDHRELINRHHTSRSLEELRKIRVRNNILENFEMCLADKEKKLHISTLERGVWECVRDIGMTCSH